MSPYPFNSLPPTYRLTQLIRALAGAPLFLAAVLFLGMWLTTPIP